MMQPLQIKQTGCSAIAARNNLLIHRRLSGTINSLGRDAVAARQLVSTVKNSKYTTRPIAKPRPWLMTMPIFSYSCKSKAAQATAAAAAVKRRDASEESMDAVMLFCLQRDQWLAQWRLRLP